MWKARWTGGEGMPVKDFALLRLPIKKHRAFFREFEQRTEQVFDHGIPIPGCRRFKGAVSMQLADMPHRGGVYLNAMSSHERGKGYGSAALRFLCDLADKHGVTLVGEASTAYSWDDEATGKKLKLQQLIEWYRRYGFTVEFNGEVWDMRREPK